jgi:hypothetical protein
VDLLEPAQAFNIPVPNKTKFVELKAEENVDSDCSSH